MAVMPALALASPQVGYTGSIYVGRLDTPAGERTDAVYLVNAVDVEKGRVRASLTIPWLVERSQWTDPVLGPAETGWQSGFTDPTARVDVEAWRSHGGLVRIRAAGSVRIPLADVESGFSTGYADVALGLSVSAVRGRHSMLADVTFWKLHDTADVNFRDAPSFFVGYGRVLDGARRWSALVSVGGGPSVIPGIEAPVQLGVSVLRVFGARGAVGVSFSVGAAGTTTDLGLATTWRVAF